MSGANGIGAWLPPVEGETGIALPMNEPAAPVVGQPMVQQAPQAPIGAPGGLLPGPAPQHRVDGQNTTVESKYSSPVAPLSVGNRYAPPPMPTYGTYGTRPVAYGTRPGARPGPGKKGMGQDDPIDGHLLGAAFIFVGLGAALGVAYGGGPLGGVAGGLFGGAALNTFRAGRAVTRGDSDSDKDAMVSGTFAVLGAGIASYILWKNKSESPTKKSKAAPFQKKVVATPNEAEDDSSDSDEDDESEDE